MYKAQDKPAQRARNSLKFFDWAYENGDKMADDLDYVPLPAPVKDAGAQAVGGEHQGRVAARPIALEVAARGAAIDGDAGAPWPLHCPPIAVEGAGSDRPTTQDRPPAARRRLALGRRAVLRRWRTARPG